jgi:hypothetical protein
MICPSHSPDFITLIICGNTCKLWNSPLCSLLQPPATSSPLGPNILLSTLFSNTLNLCSSLSVTDQVSHLYKITGKIIGLYKPQTFFERRWKILNWSEY